MKTLDKYYDHKAVEAGKFDFWKKSGYFSADPTSTKPPFSVIVPPPNVTGMLHIGHAKNTVTIDTVCRYKKLQGYDVLFAPVTDHAGIATQARVEANLRAEGLDKYQLGREEFLKRVWAWKEKCSGYIHQQWEKLGLGMDYDRDRFTFDEQANLAVNRAFKELYDQGLIYQGERIINWDIGLNTALSNIEVEHKDIPGHFYYFKYRFADDQESFVTIATTRPETMFGDVALVYNPHDERYLPFSGRRVINPANGEEVELVADRYVDKSFGTGIMKCTPAHDQHDFEIGKRHGLKAVRCMTTDGKMNELAGEFAGLDRFICRNQLVEKLRAQGDLVKIEDVVHSVGHSERSHTIVEPTMSKQWFVRMKPLAKKVLELMKGPEKMKFYPSRFEKIFSHWLTTTEDWCISRQLWWGHRIPIYTERETGAICCSETPLDPERYEQDPDVLDTWFSSSLLPFALMGWPEIDDPYYARYYPNSIMITAYDIIFFWVARMAFQGVNLTGKLPFKTVYIHGLVRDEKGRKMTKSLGNGIDPIKIIEEYGVDCLRYVCATMGTPGLDANVGLAQYDRARTFLNKYWNSARYVLSILPDDFHPVDLKAASLTFTDRYLMRKFDLALKNNVLNMDKYELGQATRYLEDFIYDDYCSTLLELSKIELRTATAKRRQIVCSLLCDLLKKISIILFPTCPFITEEVYRCLPGSRNSIYEEEYPSAYGVKGTVALGMTLNKIIRHIRNFRAENNLEPTAELEVELFASNSNRKKLAPYICYNARTETIIEAEDKAPGLVFFGDVGLLLKAKDSTAAEAKIAARIKVLKLEVERGEKMLANPNFVSKAPAEKVRCEEQKLKAYQAELDRYLKD